MDYTMVPELDIPKHIEGVTSEEMEHQQYLSSYNDESKLIRSYGYGTLATHNPEDWTHLVWTPRWCYPYNGLNIKPKCRELHPYLFTKTVFFAFWIFCTKFTMSIFTIYAPFLLILSIISVENINYYSCWQFTPVNLVLKWSRSGFRMSRVTTPQVPVGNSLPRQKFSPGSTTAKSGIINCTTTYFYLHKLLQGIWVYLKLQKTFQSKKGFPLQKLN